MEEKLHKERQFGLHIDRQENGQVAKRDNEAVSGIKVTKQGI